jgi:hypothetical protein
VSDDAVHQPTWPLLLQIEHGKIAGFWVITQNFLSYISKAIRDKG